MTANPISLVLMRPQNAFGFKPKAVGLDAGYFTAPVAEKPCSTEALFGVFGYRRPTKGKNCLRKSAFHYNAETDSYTCPVGAITYLQHHHPRRLSHLQI